MCQCSQQKKVKKAGCNTIAILYWVQVIGSMFLKTSLIDLCSYHKESSRYVYNALASMWQEDGD